MNLAHENLTKNLTNLMGIIGVSTAIAVTGYSQINQKAIAQTTPNVSTISGTNISQARLNAIDRVYVNEAAQAGMAEVEMAKLALEKSNNDNVRQYAQQMIQDHTPANKELMQLAQQKGITPPTDVGSKYQAIIAQLSQLSGADFDLAYRNEVWHERAYGKLSHPHPSITNWSRPRLASLCCQKYSHCRETLAIGR